MPPAMSYEDTLFPDITVVCAHCGDELPVRDGLGALEILWLHDHECPEAHEVAASQPTAPGSNQPQAA
jgi:hypothetical protein